jgi:hypothetical protein
LTSAPTRSRLSGSVSVRGERTPGSISVAMLKPLKCVFGSDTPHHPSGGEKGDGNGNPASIARARRHGGFFWPPACCSSAMGEAGRGHVSDRRCNSYSDLLPVVAAIADMDDFYVLGWSVSGPLPLMLPASHTGARRAPWRICSSTPALAGATSLSGTPTAMCWNF